LGFKNLSGRPDQSWLSTALSEMVTTELAAGEQLRMIPGEDIARMKIDLSLADADSYAKDTLERIRRNLGTDYVVLGSYVLLESPAKGQLRLDLRVQDTARGETLAAISETGTEENLFQLISKAGSELRSSLGVQPVTPSEAEAIRASLPSNPEAARLYSAGLAKLRLFDALGARDNLEKALKIEPGSALAHAALARAWSALGYDEKAKQEAKKGFDLSANLPREDQLSIEGQYHDAAKDWDKAIDVYRTLWSFSPDNLEYGLRLVQAQTAAGRAKDALGTIEHLRALPPPARDDVRIDLAEASAFASLRNFKGEQDAASNAARKGEAQGARLLVAQAKFFQGSASNELGDTRSAMVLLNEAKDIYAATGDKNGVARVLNSLGTLFYYSGDLDGAKKEYEESLALYREIGAKREMAKLLNNLASVLVDQRDLVAALKMREQSLEALRETGDQMSVAVALGNIGIILYLQGDLPGASRKLDAALATYQKLGAQSNMVIALNNAADINAERGEISQARNMYEEAAEICRKIGNQRDLAYSLGGLGALSLEQGNFALARWKIEEALKIRERAGEKSNAAFSRLALATVSFEEGHSVEAQSVAQEMAALFEKEKQIDEEASSYILLSRSLLAQQKFAEAQEAIERAKTLSAKSGSRDILFSEAITAARVRAATGKSAEAIKSLDATLAEATRYGFVSQQYEARLALGEIEMKSGASAAGRARLARLQKDATAKGFLLIAHKAAAAAANR
jgi:tetratricopeptide (TPR) repeat protein